MSVLVANPCTSNASPKIYTAELVSDLYLIRNGKRGDIAIVTLSEGFQVWAFKDDYTIAGSAVEGVDYIVAKPCGYWVMIGHTDSSGGVIGYTIKYFGGVGDGDTDDTGALDDFEASSVADLLVVSGTYRISSNTTISESKNLIFSRDAMFEIDAGVTLTINGTIQAGLWQIFSGDGNIAFGKPLTIFPEWWGAVGDETTDDAVALQACFTAVPIGGTIVGEKTYMTNTALLLSKNKVSVSGGTILAGPSFLDTAYVLSLSGVSMRVSGLSVDGNEIASRGVLLMPGSHDFIADKCDFVDFYADAANAIIPSGVRIAGASAHVTFRNCKVDGANTDHANGISRGYYISGIGAEAEPSFVNIIGGSVKNVGPDTDGDGISFQYQVSWTEKLHSIVQGVAFENCSKRAVKIMLSGVTIDNCTGDGFSYSAVSAYGSFTKITNCVFSTSGYCVFDAGLSDDTKSFEDIQIIGNTIGVPAGGDVITQGHAIRVFGLVDGLNISRNNIKHVRQGVWATGQIRNSRIDGNIITDSSLIGIQLDDELIGATTYTPDTVSISGNILSDVAIAPIAVSESANVSCRGNLYNGTATIVSFTACTNCTQSENLSDSDIGLATAQFGLDATGRPQVKDGAVLSNVRFTSVGIGIGAPGVGGGIALEHSGNFLFGSVVDNTSNGVAAEAAYVLRNDDDLTAVFSLTGSAFTGTPSAARLTSSAGVSWTFGIGGVDSLMIDSNLGAGNTRLLIYDVDNATLERVSVGVPDSGGAGFKVLRIPN